MKRPENTEADSAPAQARHNRPPLVGIIMGSDSDWPTMKLAAEACAEFGVPCEARVVSAHRTLHA